MSMLYPAVLRLFLENEKEPYLNPSYLRFPSCLNIEMVQVSEIWRPKEPSHQQQ